MAFRLGTEDKKKRIIATVLVSLALTLIAHTVWDLASGPSSYTTPPTSAVSTPAYSSIGGANGSHSAQQLEGASALDPTLHPERMALAENTRYTGTSRNIFSKDSLPPVAATIEKPITSVRTGPAVPTGPPPPPPINLKFYGFATEHNGQKMIFLQHGEDLFIAGSGDIVDGRYKVLQINPTSVLMEDLSYNNTQTLPLQTS